MHPSAFMWKCPSNEEWGSKGMLPLFLKFKNVFFLVYIFLAYCSFKLDHDWLEACYKLNRKVTKLCSQLNLSFLFSFDPLLYAALYFHLHTLLHQYVPFLCNSVQTAKLNGKSHHSIKLLPLYNAYSSFHPDFFLTSSQIELGEKHNTAHRYFSPVSYERWLRL